MTGIWDKITGNDTYYQDPEWQGEIKEDNRTDFARKIDDMASHNDNPIGYAWQTLIPAAEIAGAVMAIPKVALEVPKVVRLASRPTFLKGVRTVGYPIVGGIAVNAGVNSASKAITGKSWEENTSPYTGYTFNFLADPGSLTNPVSYPIFYKQSKNLLDLGRYTMDVLPPASYSWKGAFRAMQAIGTAMNPFTKPPKFGEDKKPKWYKKYSSVINDRENRLQNNAIWAGVPESEVPRTNIYRRPDGTYGFYETVEQNTASRVSFPTKDEALKASEFTKDGRPTANAPDFTFGIGGEHSDYTLKGEGNLNGIPFTLWQYEDEQKLNPQWLIADKLKKVLRITDKDGNPTGKRVKLGNAIDKVGGIDLKPLIGYDNDIQYR